MPNIRPVVQPSATNKASAGQVSAMTLCLLQQNAAVDDNNMQQIDVKCKN